MYVCPRYISLNVILFYSTYESIFEIPFPVIPI